MVALSYEEQGKFWQNLCQEATPSESHHGSEHAPGVKHQPQTVGSTGGGGGRKGGIGTHGVTTPLTDESDVEEDDNIGTNTNVGSVGSIGHESRDDARYDEQGLARSRVGGSSEVGSGTFHTGGRRHDESVTFHTDSENSSEDDSVPIHPSWA
jgi:hypothetical protein